MSGINKSYEAAKIRVNCSLRDKDGLLDCFMTLEGYEKSDVRFLVVFFIRRALKKPLYIVISLYFADLVSY
jgi:hypothetical protein